MGTPVDSKRRMTPAGVQGVNRGTEARDERWPILYAWNLFNPIPIPTVRHNTTRSKHTSKDVPIHVFLWADSLSDRTLALRTDMIAQRQLDKNPTDRLVVIELLNDTDDLVDLGVRWEVDVLGDYADLLSGLVLHADIDAGIGACACLDDDELGLETRELALDGLDASGNILANGPARRITHAMSIEILWGSYDLQSKKK